MSKPKPINFRPNQLEDLLLQRIASDYPDLPNISKSELVRLCIRIAGEKTIPVEEFNNILREVNLL